MSSIDYDKVRSKGREDLFYFAKYILGYDLLEKGVHWETAKLCPKKQRLLIMFPRDCFKTTIFVVAYTLWLIIQLSSVKYKTGVNEKILLSRKTYSESKKLLSEINDHLKNNELLRALYGDFRQGSKILDEKVILKRGLKDKDATVTLSGLDNSITGGHFTRIINDDLVNRLDRKSQVQRDNTLAYCKDLINMKDGTNTQYVYVGTRWHLRDIYYELIEGGSLGTYSVIEKPFYNEDGSFFFRNRFTDREVEDLKKDSINWSSQYLLNPLSEDFQLYSEKTLNYFDGVMKGERFLYYDGAEGKDEGDYTSIIEGVRVENRLYIVDWFVERWDVSKSMDFIARRFRDYGHTLITLETNRDSLLGMTLKQRIKNIDNRLAPPINEIKNTANKQERIQSMQPTVKDYVYFKRKEDQSSSYARGFEQLTFYPVVEHDDAPDSLEGLIKYSLRNIRNFGENDIMITRKRS